MYATDRDLDPWAQFKVVDEDDAREAGVCVCECE